MPLEARFRDGRIEIEPAPLKVELRERQGILVAVPLEDVGPLSSAEVEETLSNLRTERG